MTAAEDQDEKRRAEGLIAETPSFPGVERVHVELGKDSTGDPSMWPVFHLRPDLDANVPWVRAFTEYSTKLSLKLINKGLVRFPYTRIERVA